MDLLAFILAQQITIQLGRPVTVYWGPHHWESVSKIDNYQVLMDDDKTWTPTNQTVPKEEYEWIIPQSRLTLGTHTLYLRACSGSNCGKNEDALSIVFIVEETILDPPTRVRIKP